MPSRAGKRALAAALLIAAITAAAYFLYLK